MRQGSRNFIFWGATAAIVSAFTTFLLWFLPTTYPAPEGFDEIISIHAEPAYMARLWVNFVHVFIALFAYAAVAAVIFKRSPVWSITGLIAFAFWCLAEALGVSINIWAVNADWRAAFGAADDSQQQLIRASLHTFSGIWYGIFFVILVTFLIGTLSYGIALWNSSGLQKILSILFLLAVPLTLVIVLDSYFGANLSPLISWSYPTLQPLSRGLMGVWLLMLWRNSATPSSER